MISVTVRPRLRIQVRGVPQSLEPGPDAGIVGLLVVRVEHRDQTHVRGALHVVLPAQRVQPGARLAHVPGDRAHCDQAAGVVGAGGVLGDSHAPEDDPGGRLAPGPGHPPDDVGVHAGDLRCPLRRVVRDGRGERVVVAGTAGDEVAVGQPQPDHLVHHAVVERDVGAGLELAEDVGVIGHLVGARVHVDDRGAVAPGLLEERRGDRVVSRGVAAGDDRHVGVHHVAVGGGHGARADALEQRGHAGGVAQPGAVVHIVGVEPGPDQLLEEVGLLVGALGRAEAGDRPRPAVGVDLGEPPGDQVQRLLPGRLPEVRQHFGVIDKATGPAPAPPLAFLAALAAVARAPSAVLARWAVHLAADVCGQWPPGVGRVTADQWRGEALRRGGVVPAVPALHAQAALRAGLVATLGVGDRAALGVHVVGQGAADAAVRADAVHLLQLGARPDRDVVDRLVGQRAGRARRDALTAGDAGRLAHGVVQVERDAGRCALAAAPYDVVALDVVAGPDAPVAENASVVVHRDDRVRGVGAAAGGDRQSALAADPVPLRQGEQFVVAGGGLLGVADRPAAGRRAAARSAWPGCAPRRGWRS